MTICTCDYPILIKDIKQGFYTRMGCGRCNQWYEPSISDGRPTCSQHHEDCPCDWCCYVAALPYVFVPKVGA